MNVIIGPMPERIAALPRDERGYPIPWNVLRAKDGTPIFTVNDADKHLFALVESICPLCGQRLGKHKWFVGGPRSAFDPNGRYFDLPGHKECVEFALRTCPWLAAPNYRHRIDILPSAQAKTDAVLVDITQIPERPLLFVAVCSARVNVQDNGPGVLPYVWPGKPFLGVQYWQLGVQLSDAEGERLVKSLGLALANETE